MRSVGIEDLRRRALRRLPMFLFGYLEGGGYEEETLRRNRADLERICLLPRALNDVSSRTISKTLLGKEAAMPVALAPVGAAGFFSPNGEVAAARAAQTMGVPFCLSTLSIGTIEDIAQCAVWLVSGAASYVHGETIVVDGGAWLPGAKAMMP